TDDEERCDALRADDGSFGSGRIDDGWSHTFTQPGTVAYSCTNRPEIRGTIQVQVPSPLPADAAAGASTPGAVGAVGAQGGSALGALAARLSAPVAVQALPVAMGAKPAAVPRRPARSWSGSPSDPPPPVADTASSP